MAFFVFKRNLFCKHASTVKTLAMKTFNLFLVLTLILSLATSSCIEDDSDSFCDSQLIYLSSLKANIEGLAATSICNENFECRYIAFGSKPCGGPWEFLFYTTSIDTMELENLVASYNALEADYNENCDAVSDCSTPIPPIDFSCENNQCIPIY